MKKTLIHKLSLMLILYSCQPNKWNSEENKQHSSTNSLSIELLSLRDSIATFNEVQDKRIGYAGIQSIQYSYYEKLLAISSDSDLILLTSDSNYVVSTYATFGLIDRKNEKFLKVFEKFLKEDQTIKTMKGCLKGNDLVSSEIYHEYWNKIRIEADDEKQVLQNDKILLKMDSLILEKENADWLLYHRALNNRIYDKKYVELISNIAFQKDNIYAIEYLYKNNLVQYQNKIIESLKSYLNKENIPPIYYDKIFEMILSFQSESLNVILIKELKDIEKQYGNNKMKKYKKILIDKNVKI